MSWPQIFVDLPPGTRVCVPRGMEGFYAPGSWGVVLTHSNDGCTLVAFDAPLKSEATKTKPADAWWVQTQDVVTTCTDDELWLRHPQTIEAKRQWDAVAHALGADPDSYESVHAAACAADAEEEPIGTTERLYTRAEAAAQMRAMAPARIAGPTIYSDGHNQCRRDMLAAITEWESAR